MMFQNKIKITLLVSLLLFTKDLAFSAKIVPITGRIFNEKTQAPVYKANVYILDTDLNVKTSELGSFNFLSEENSLCDTISLLIARYEYESKAIRIPLAELSQERLNFTMARYFHTPEVLNYPNLAVSGKVTDETGRALDDVVIYASGTNGFSCTDGSGKFKLKIEQMRPDIHPVLWFCKKGFKTKQIGLKEFEKRKIVRLTKTKGESHSLTIKFQNDESELLESVKVVLDGKIYDSTGILGTVTLGIEAGSISTIRISQQYNTSAEGRRHAIGTFFLAVNSLPSELTLTLNRNYQFALAAEHQKDTIFDWQNLLPYTDSLLIAHLEPIPDPELKETVFVKFKSSGLASHIYETGEAISTDRIELPIIDLPEIHIIVASSAALPIPSIPRKNEDLAQPPSDSFEFNQANPRSAETMNKAIREHDRVIQDFYKQALKMNPNLKGSLELRFVLNSNGEIEHADIISSTLANPEMEQPIIEKIKQWRNFPPVDPHYGKRTYKLKYNFGNF